MSMALAFRMRLFGWLQSSKSWRDYGQWRGLAPPSGSALFPADQMIGSFNRVLGIPRGDPIKGLGLLLGILGVAHPAELLSPW